MNKKNMDFDKRLNQAIKNYDELEVINLMNSLKNKPNKNYFLGYPEGNYQSPIVQALYITIEANSNDKRIIGMNIIKILLDNYVYINWTIMQPILDILNNKFNNDKYNLIILILKYMKNNPDYVYDKDSILNSLFPFAKNDSHAEMFSLLFELSENIRSEYSNDYYIQTFYDKHQLLLLKILTKYIVKHKLLDINKLMSSGWTILMMYSSLDDENMVQFLLENGADPNVLDINGDSTLNYALSNIIIIKLLFEYGFDIKNENYKISSWGVYEYLLQNGLKMLDKYKQFQDIIYEFDALNTLINLI
jgi:hypothetical protein